jgi:hypothetical protein
VASVSVERRAREDGLLAPSTKLFWMRQVYCALVGEALLRSNTDTGSGDADPDSLATLVVNTLLHGFMTVSVEQRYCSVAAMRGPVSPVWL